MFWKGLTTAALSAGLLFTALPAEQAEAQIGRRIARAAVRAAVPGVQAYRGYSVAPRAYYAPRASYYGSYYSPAPVYRSPSYYGYGAPDYLDYYSPSYTRPGYYGSYRGPYSSYYNSYRPGVSIGIGGNPYYGGTGISIGTGGLSF